MKDLRIEMRIKNNFLYQEIINQYENIGEFCEKHDLSRGIVLDYLAFRTSPFLKSKNLNRKNLVFNQDFKKLVKHSAQQIIEALDVEFLDVFPPISHEVRKNNFAVELNSDDLIAFNENIHSIEHNSDYLSMFDMEELNNAIQSMPESAQAVLTKRFGFEGEAETLEVVGQGLNLSRERVRQIEAKCLRNLRHPSKSNKIRVVKRSEKK